MRKQGGSVAGDAKTKKKKMGEGEGGEDFINSGLGTLHAGPAALRSIGFSASAAVEEL